MWRLAVLVLSLCVVSPERGSGQPEGLPEPAGEVLLTISGRIANTNSGDSAVFDRAMLEALGLAKLRTSTVWTNGVSEFEGVPARRLMEAVGAGGDTLVATALNDYKVEIPISDFETYPVLFALKMNGRELSVRDKGPIWIVYPRDDFPELRTDLTNSRWIWQLSRIDVR